MWVRDVAQPDIYQFKTGFNVNGNAFDFAWYITIRAETAWSTYNYDWSDFGPKKPSSSWTSGWQNDDSPINGYHYARVTRGHAILTDGRVCFTGFPTDAAYVT